MVSCLRGLSCLEGPGARYYRHGTISSEGEVIIKGNIAH